MMTRILPFVVVGALGFVVQISLLSALTGLAHWPTALATALAVEAAVLVNFAWHCRWTWRDRPAHGGRLAQLARFHLSNGLVPIVANVIITVALTSMASIPPAAANVVAVVLLSAMNFTAADRWVFVSGASAAALLLSAGPALAASPAGNTLQAWNDHVARVEASLPARMSEPAAEPQGRIVGVPDGSIHEWRGSVLVRNTTVAALVQALQDPEHAPLPDDVAESRLLTKDGDTLRVYFKLVRKVLITVTYDTEHDVKYTRVSPGLVTSRSVATRIVETNGKDRGFLWRLNSYWRYQQIGQDVRVDVVSVSLSRSVPGLVRLVVEPLIARVGRESMQRTLDAVERTGARTAAASSRDPHGRAD
jgi:putative flippase GtrA